MIILIQDEVGKSFLITGVDVTTEDEAYAFVGEKLKSILEENLAGLSEEEKAKAYRNLDKRGDPVGYAWSHRDIFVTGFAESDGNRLLNGGNPLFDGDYAPLRKKD